MLRPSTVKQTMRATLSCKSASSAGLGKLRDWNRREEEMGFKGHVSGMAGIITLLVSFVFSQYRGLYLYYTLLLVIQEEEC